MVKQFLLCTLILVLVCELPAQQYGSFKDSRNSKAYKTVKIGQQEWLAENLNTDRFRNGDLIPEAKTPDEWEKAGKNKQPAWCQYKINNSNGSYKGKLYNGYAVLDPRGLAPVGWHIPLAAEWDSMKNILNHNKLHMHKTDDWGKEQSLRIGAQTESGLSISPNPSRPGSGIFTTDATPNASFWLLTENDKAFIQSIRSGSTARFTPSEIFKSIGVAVRCIKDYK